ncbi:MAG: VCBS repeat-containing protein [Proteobacteria bacterium]|nr:VCBS repeat-containing protein [Pseudomonadota bacterium]
MMLVGLGTTGSSEAQVAFNDIAAAAGIGGDFYSGTTNHGSGVNWLDYNNDGWPDLLMVNGEGYDCLLYRNEGDGTFSDQSALLPVIDTDLELTHSAFADYDNDGDVDLYIGVAATRYGPDGPTNILLKNLWMENGGATVPGQPLFVDVAAAAGVQQLANPPLGALLGYETFTLGWVDFDRDGCVDLFVGSMAWDLGGDVANTNTLYRNKCDGTFEDVTIASGLTDGGANWLRPTLAFAAGRAEHTGGGLALLYVVEPGDFQHWLGVEEIAREEGVSKAKAVFRLFRRRLKKLGFENMQPEEIIREGNKADTILALIEQDADIAVLVLGASKDPSGPGPLVSMLAAGKYTAEFPIPITIVPGTLSDEEIQALA